MKRKNLILYITLAIVVIVMGWIFFWLQNNSSQNSNVSLPAPTFTIDPVTIVSYLAYGDELFEANDLDGAFDAYNISIKNEVELAGAFAGRGNIYMVRRHFSKAVSDFTESLKHFETPDVLANRCNAYRMTAKYDLARDDCNAALQLDTESIDAHLSLAMLYLDQGNTGSAKETIQELISIHPDNAEAYLVLSQITLSENNIDEAIELLSKAIEIAPTEPHLYWERGFIFYVDGRVSDAKEDMQMVLDYASPATDGELLLKAGSLLSSLEGVP